MTRKKRNDMAKDTMSFVGENVMMSVGTQVVAGMPASCVRTSGLAGMGNLARFQRTKGTIIGAGHTMNMLRGLLPEKKRR